MAAGAPQMVASLLALAILARSGPFDAVLLCMPDLLPALDQRFANASPPLLALLDFCAGLPRFAIEVGVELEDLNDDCVDAGIVGRAENAEGVD